MLSKMQYKPQVSFPEQTIILRERSKLSSSHQINRESLSKSLGLLSYASTKWPPQHFELLGGRTLEPPRISSGPASSPRWSTWPASCRAGGGTSSFPPASSISQPR
uniref:Uncharacterized protein n=1 Tax=Zea mays TaxID=4577 RepID=C4IY48_MAIZE|nr:unknown [Zea mays]